MIDPYNKFKVIWKANVQFRLNICFDAPLLTANIIFLQEKQQVGTRQYLDTAARKFTESGKSIEIYVRASLGDCV